MRVDRIEISGVTVLSATEVESTLELTVGEALDRQKIMQSFESLRTLYRNKGYESAVVKAQMSRIAGEAVLALSIDEGLPTRVAKITFQAGELRDDFDSDRWDQLIRDLDQKTREFELGVHELEKVSGINRLIKEMLAAEDYIGVRVDEQVTEESPPTVTGTVPAAGR